MSQYHDFFAEPEHTPMYSIEYVSSYAEMRRTATDQIRGMGKYQDLQRLLRFEVAR